MKKFASLMLALALCMGLAVPAMAAGTTETLSLDGITVTLSNVLSKEVRTVSIEEGFNTETGEYYAVNKEVTVCHLPETGGTVTVSANRDEVDILPGEMIYVLKDGVYKHLGGEQRLDGPGSWNAEKPDLSWLGEPVGDYLYNCGVLSDGPSFYVVFDGKADAAQAETPVAPAAPAEPAAPVEPAVPAAPAAPAAPATPGSYTAKKGDTWSSICTNFYGDNAQRYELTKANKDVKLKEGAVVTLPEKLGNVALIAAPVAGEGEALYTVKLGDTLGKIAAAQYGKVSEYKAIFERNSDRLKNANIIYEGQVIVLPAK